MKLPHKKPVALRWTIRLALYIIGIGVWISGGAWLVLHYYFMRQGEFGPEVNPMEPWSLRIHGAFAFGAIWILGLLWGVHVTKLWRKESRRFSGAWILGVAAWLVVSGYLLYYLGDTSLRSVVSILHWGTGLAIPFFFIWHRVRLGRRRKRARKRTRVPNRNEMRPAKDRVFTHNEPRFFN